MKAFITPESPVLHTQDELFEMACDALFPVPDLSARRSLHRAITTMPKNGGTVPPPANSGVRFDECAFPTHLQLPLFPGSPEWGWRRVLVDNTFSGSSVFECIAQLLGSHLWNMERIHRAVRTGEVVVRVLTDYNDVEGNVYRTLGVSGAGTWYYLDDENLRVDVNWFDGNVVHLFTLSLAE